jgi:hypothetical protein
MYQSAHPVLVRRPRLVGGVEERLRLAFLERRVYVPAVD